MIGRKHILSIICCISFILILYILLREKLFHLIPIMKFKYVGTEWKWKGIYVLHQLNWWNILLQSLVPLCPPTSMLSRTRRCWTGWWLGMWALWLRLSSASSTPSRRRSTRHGGPGARHTAALSKGETSPGWCTGICSMMTRQVVCWGTSTYKF